MERVQLLLLWAESLEELPDQQLSDIVKLWKALELVGLLSICSPIWLTQESTFPEIRCHSLESVEKLRKHILLPSCQPFDYSIDLKTPTNT